MSQSHRHSAGGRIDRTRPLSFQFNGKRYTGFAGDTLASALLANDVKVVSRSFKFHRPRGILSAGVEEPNALLGVDTGSGMIPVSRATIVPLIEGLVAESQNCFPSLGFDVGRILDYTRSLWPAGFYNKIFKWPNWHTFEGAVRKMAGLGKLVTGEDHCRYRHMNAHCDLLIVGAGPAGLKNALDAGRRGDDVIIAEQDIQAGGSLLYDNTSIAGKPTDEWLKATLNELGGMGNVRLMTHSTVAGYYDHNVLTVHDRSAVGPNGNAVETFWKVRANNVVLATGAIEQPLMFGNNDLPGIMLASALHCYSVQYAVRVGDNVLGLVNNDIAWRSLLAAKSAGVNVTAILDIRESISDALQASATDQGISVIAGAKPLAARGAPVVKALRIIDASGHTREFRCDAIAMSAGLNPTTHLYSQAGGTLRYDDKKACFVPDQCRQSVAVIGNANGEFGESEYNIAERKPATVSTNTQWVDYLHDVTVSDLELAVRENFVSVEHLKRYTTTGMAVDQGKTSNLNALSVLAQLTGRHLGDVGTTTFRPQFMPVTMGAIAGNRRGDFYTPPRYLPAHDWHAAQGAAFDDYGGWRRPAFYGVDRNASILAEAKAVRAAAGLFDGSPLGKIEVKGPDAAEFLNRIYVNTVHTLKPGKVRYGLMLNENGIVMDDGVFVRLAEDHFLVNSTSGAAERIAEWLEEWHQCEWPQLQVLISPVTSFWAVATVAGPRSREILSSLEGMIDLTTEVFAHMSFAKDKLVDGTPYRIQRVSFTGEMSFELSVPASRVTDIFARLYETGAPLGMTLLGLEALMVLRMEKGFLHVGGDTDGMTNALDVGFGHIVENKKDDFIGARSLSRPNDLNKDRRQVIGFEVINNDIVLPGAHFVVADDKHRRSEGFVTSACVSPVLGKTIGLGLLERGFNRKNEEVLMFDEGRMTKARVVDACFYDPDGARTRG